MMEISVGKCGILPLLCAPTQPGLLVMDWRTLSSSQWKKCHVYGNADSSTMVLVASQSQTAYVAANSVKIRETCSIVYHDPLSSNPQAGQWNRYSSASCSTTLAGNHPSVTFIATLLLFYCQMSMPV